MTLAADRTELRKAFWVVVATIASGGLCVWACENQSKASTERTEKRLKEEREGPCRDELHTYAGPCPNDRHELEVNGSVNPIAVCRCKGGPNR